MVAGPRRLGFLCLILFLVGAVLKVHAAPASWRGNLRDAEGHPVANAAIELHSTSGNHEYSTKTSATGDFVLAEIVEGAYSLRVTVAGKTWTAASTVAFKDDASVSGVLELSSTDAVVRVITSGEGKRTQGSGGEKLSSGEVSSLPLNERDFSKLLLLAAGTMTDTNGAANFTQQFAANGQRGVTSVFATDGVDTTDPELGGATFSNFNVDAIQEVQSSSGVMSADIGHGAAGFTNVVTKSGNDFVHGSAFEFVRNAAFDARNFFDHSGAIDPRRLPPFARNEFGVTNGRPIVLPKIYDGRDKTFYFVEYQGFRQVLGTTQVFAVPTAAERQGIDTTTFPGDTLFVPVSSKIASVLARYPLPNEPSGPYGD
ncbi:MAG TPA: carboxypeptidase-like regulatory domain-containing protein, partial [Candidatus Eremiobacteraceae bacterium]|nr:carboxypeptidase-like regulatory domain-containing protein [Candidatus Eremiobacteraceae bacterium]